MSQASTQASNSARISASTERSRRRGSPRSRAARSAAAGRPRVSCEAWSARDRRPAARRRRRTHIAGASARPRRCRPARSAWRGRRARRCSRRCSRRRRAPVWTLLTLRTGTGASGEIRLQSPSRYSSRIASPSTSTRWCLKADTYAARGSVVSLRVILSSRGRPDHASGAMGPEPSLGKGGSDACASPAVAVNY